jgi:hypothetical protein
MEKEDINPSTGMPDFCFFGELKGLLGEHLTSLSTNQKPDESSAPFIIEGSALPNLTGEERQALKQRGFPAIVLNAISDEIVLLHEIMETGLTAGLAPDVNMVAAYAIDREPDGTWWDAVFHVFPEVAKQALTIVHTNENGTQVVTEIDEGIVSIDPVGLENRGVDSMAQSLFDWLSISGNRNGSEMAIAAKSGFKSTRAGASENELTALAMAFVHDSYWFGTKNGRTNTYIISTFCYSCYEVNYRTSWFYVQQYCVFSASTNWVKNTATEKYWYTDLYEIDLQPAQFMGLPSFLSLVQSSPGTTEGSTTTTSSVEKSISGTIGFEGKSLINGSVTGGISISNSTTIEIKDVSVRNISTDLVNNAKWQFIIPRCTKGSESGCIDDLSAAKLVSYSTFQPLNQWIWKASEAVRNAGPLEMKTFFNTRWIRSYVGSCNIFGCNCDINAQSWMPVMDPDTVFLPLPPKPVGT